MITLLHASDQVDFDGRFHGNGGVPRFVRGRVRWFDASDFPRDPYWGFHLAGFRVLDFR